MDAHGTALSCWTLFLFLWLFAFLYTLRVDRFFAPLILQLPTLSTLHPYPLQQILLLHPPSASNPCISVQYASCTNITVHKTPQSVVELSSIIKSAASPLSVAVIMAQSEAFPQDTWILPKEHNPFIFLSNLSVLEHQMHYLFESFAESQFPLQYSSYLFSQTIFSSGNQSQILSLINGKSFFSWCAVPKLKEPQKLSSNLRQNGTKLTSKLLLIFKYHKSNCLRKFWENILNLFNGRIFRICSLNLLCIILVRHFFQKIFIFFLLFIHSLQKLRLFLRKLVFWICSLIFLHFQTSNLTLTSN